MTTKHTPGPWTWTADLCDPREPRIISAADGIEGAQVWWQGSADEADANARLIALAPEMLEALKAEVERIETLHTLKVRQAIPDWFERLAALRALIARAEGGQP